MSSIGGYFELELSEGSEHHSDALRINTARNALEYILKANAYTKVYIPYYTCDVILEPLLKLNIEYEFYAIDSKLEPIFDYNTIKKEEAFLYTNYFGIKDDFVNELSGFCKNLIIDNAQSFFHIPIKGIDSFYSARKFFGVPDGAYVYSHIKLKEELVIDSSLTRLNHLVKRIETKAEDGYEDFTINEENLSNQPLKQMSVFTQRMLKSINYDNIISKRRENFNYLAQTLGTTNELDISSNPSLVPMVYPFLKVGNNKIFKKLIENKIYIAKYWPNIKSWTQQESFEYYLAENTLALPIDQRYTLEDMERIIKIIKDTE